MVAPSKLASYKTEVKYICKWCPHAPFSKEGHYTNHLQKHHSAEWKAYLAGEESPYIDFSEMEPAIPPAEPTPDGDDITTGRYSRIVIKLARPLTSLETRITTSIQVQNQDFDSDNEEDVSGASSSSDAAPKEAVKPPNRIEEFPTPVKVLKEDMSAYDISIENIWDPYRGGYEFKLARWMNDANLPKSLVDRFFNEGHAREPPLNVDGTEGICFTSAYTFDNLLDQMDPDVSINSWERKAVKHHGVNIEFRHRSVEAMIRHILRQPAHRDYTVYTPIKEFDGESGYRVYSELHTAIWWWSMQVRQDSTPHPLDPLTGNRKNWIAILKLRATSSSLYSLGPMRPSKPTSRGTRTSGPST